MSSPRPPASELRLDPQTNARQKEKQRAKDGHAPQRDTWVPALPVPGEKTSLLLQQRSKETLRRRKKVDTLY